MNSIQLTNVSADFGEHFSLENIDWAIEPGQHWVITGTNGAGKSAMAALLAGYGDISAGQISGLPERVAIVSFEAQQELIERERKKDDADILDVIAIGTPVREIIEEGAADVALALDLAERFNLTSHLDKPFRNLSTGETRKLMLVRALASDPQLLILDEPFDGLDVDAHAMLQGYLAKLVETVPVITVLNRFDEFPEWASHVAYMDSARLHHCIEMSDKAAFDNLYQLLHLKTTELEVPEGDPETAIAKLPADQPLVRLSNINIRYAERHLIEDLSWTINPGEHWQLSGPNGSGKTGLLTLITGDHPQCYSNDIFVFGFQRGSGESIWQIKQYIGYVSTALQWEYKVGISLRNVIISGFYDSIGLYTKATDRQRQIADQWLALLGMSDAGDQPFNQRSYGDQRLLLIARAMVKHPPLLILDEPCLGLDDINRQLVLALIEKICAGTETTVLYVNHHPEDKISGIERYLALEAN